MQTFKLNQVFEVKGQRARSSVSFQVESLDHLKQTLSKILDTADPNNVSQYAVRSELIKFIDDSPYGVNRMVESETLEGLAQLIEKLWYE